MQQPAIQRKQLDAAGAAGDGAQTGGGVAPSRDDLVLLANARCVAGFGGYWPAHLSPAKIAYLQYEKRDWTDGKIQTLAKLIDDACRARELPVFAYGKASWDGLRCEINASSVGNGPEFVSLDCAPMKDGSPSEYFSITPDDLAAWWRTLKTSPSELLAAWMQVPCTASQSSITRHPVTPKEWANGCRKVAWDVALNLDAITAAGLEEKFKLDDRVQWDEQIKKYVLENRGDFPDRMCEVSPGSFRSWATELKKAQGRR